MVDCNTRSWCRMRYEGEGQWRGTSELFPTPRFVQRHNHRNTQRANMEEDRAATNLGPLEDDGLVGEPPVVPKQPKRRFVGRKTAENAASPPADPNANIEDSSALQGARLPKDFEDRFQS